MPVAHPVNDDVDGDFLSDERDEEGMLVDLDHLKTPTKVLDKSRDADHFFDPPVINKKKKLVRLCRECA